MHILSITRLLYNFNNGWFWWEIMRGGRGGGDVYIPYGTIDEVCTLYEYTIRTVTDRHLIELQTFIF